MDPVDPREFGRLEAMVETQGREIGELKAAIKGMSGKLDELFELANRSRGGFWVGMTIVSMGGALVGWISHYLLGR